MKFLLGTDVIGVGSLSDSQKIAKIQARLQKDGHSVVNVGVGASKVQSALRSGKYKGYTAIMLVGGLGDGGTFFDYEDGIGKYYTCDFAYIIGCKELGGAKSTIGQGMKWCMNHKMKYIASGTSRSVPYRVSEWNGVTMLDWNKKYGKHCKALVVDTFEQLIQIVEGKTTIEKLLKGVGTGKSASLNGYDKDKPFQAYLDVYYDIYTKNPNYKKGGKERYYIPKVTGKHITIDWSAEALDSQTNIKWSNSENKSDVKLNIQNFTDDISRIDLLGKIQATNNIITESQKKNDTNRYILKKVLMRYNPLRVLDDASTEQNESLLYQKDDNCTYKMKLYNISFDNSEAINGKLLGVSGKTVLEAMNTILENGKYFCRMKYNKHRENDTLHIVPLSELNTSNVIDTFQEGFDGNVLGISNIKFNPVDSRVNTDILIYKKKERNKQNTAEYEYYYNARAVNLKDILTYGEFGKIESSEIISSSVEARQQCRLNYEANYSTNATYTLKTVGLPLCQINNYVQTIMSDDNLTGTYLVASRSITIDPSNRPIVQTELGLGEVSNQLKTLRNLEKQRKELIRKKIDINKPSNYGTENELM